MPDSMTVCVVMEHRFVRTPDGHAWTGAAFNHSFFSRYLAAFDRVRVIARAKDVDEPPSGYSAATGQSVEFAAVPYYHGPLGFALKANAVHAAVNRAVKPGDAVILRVPSNLARLITPKLLRNRHTYAVEVVGDPYDVYAPGAVRHPLRAFFRQLFYIDQKRQCKNAIAASYVTQSILQKRYPCRGFTTDISSVELTPQAFKDEPRNWTDSESVKSMPLRLLFAGSLEQMYKGLDVLIDAIAILEAKGIEIELTILGDGKHRAELEARCRRIGVENQVVFRGLIPSGDPVRAEMDKADLFILPSRTEGLPRAMIEAMARALPCIGTTAGGIPELLESDNMVRPGDALALSNKIEEVLADQARMSAMSTRNLNVSRDYRSELLNERRSKFYRQIRIITEETGLRKANGK